jgi:hypothetical protein
MFNKLIQKIGYNLLYFDMLNGKILLFFSSLDKVQNIEFITLFLFNFAKNTLSMWQCLIQLELQLGEVPLMAQGQLEIVLKLRA